MMRIGADLCPFICSRVNISPIAKTSADEIMKKKEIQRKIVDEEEDIEHQEIDNSTYKYIMLSNGIKMLLVEDSTASTSACSLEIKIGNFSDPPHLPGLAHLLEHILLTGSELFPVEDFSAFLSSRGGSNNAYTTSTFTNFQFDIPKEHFLNALDRFVSFFICPVFHEKNIQHHIEIIQCEHEKNKQNDVWRTKQVEKLFTNSKHPFSKFSTGTRKTFQVDSKSNKNLKYEAYNFFKRYYSANLMSISIIHNASIEKLEEIATEKFLLIQNKNIPQNIYRNPVFRPDQIGLKIFIVPIREMYHLNLTFPLLEYEENYMSSPGSFISQLIGHKGIGSIFSLLSRRDLAHNVVSCYKRLNLSNFSLILVTVQLTEYGERHIDSIITIVFQYIHMLRQQPLPKYFFDELTNFAQSEFEMKEREKAVTFAETLAHAIHIFSPKQIIKGCYSSPEWRPRQIENILAELNPSNLRVTILTKNAKYLETKVEPYYGTEYYVDKIQENVIQKWKNVSLNQDLRLPSPNPYNYTRMNKFVKTGKTRYQPELTVLLERARMKVWLSPDQRFMFPKSYFYFKFSSPQTYKTARSWNLTNLMVNMIKHILVESTYPALLAGLSYTLKAAKYGFELLVQGYSEKIFMFLLEILNAIYCTQYTEDVFSTVLHVHKKGLLSCYAEPLKSQSRYLVNTLLSSRVWTRKERWESLQDIELQEVEDFARTFLDKHSLECLVFGNVNKDQICKLSEILLKRRAEYLELRCSNLCLKITSDPNLADWFKTDSVERIVRCEKVILQAKSECSNSFTCEYDEWDLLLPLGSNAVVIDNEHHTMSMVVFFLQLSSITIEKTCSLELFNHIVRERIISCLRNRIFLGNTIGCDVRKINHTIGLRIQVESQFPPSAVNSAIEDCLENLDPFLKSLNHSDLKVHLNTLKALKMNSHMKMIDYNQILWREILEGSYDFRRNHREVEHLNFLTLCKVKNFYNEYIKKGAPERRKLLLSIAPDPTLNSVECLCEEQAMWIYSWQEIDKLRKKCEHFPDPEVKEITSWFVDVFRGGDDFYQPPGEQLESFTTKPLSVHFKYPCSTEE